MSLRDRVNNIIDQTKSGFSEFSERMERGTEEISEKTGNLRDRVSNVIAKASPIGKDDEVTEQERQIASALTRQSLTKEAAKGIVEQNREDVTKIQENILNQQFKRSQKGLREMGKTVLQETARSGASIGLSLIAGGVEHMGPSIRKLFGKDPAEKELEEKAEEIRSLNTSDDPVAKFIFGDRKGRVQSVEGRIAKGEMDVDSFAEDMRNKANDLEIDEGPNNASETLRSVAGGLEDYSLPLSLLGTAGILAVDFTTGGLGKLDDAAKAIAKTDNIGDISKSLKGVVNAGESDIKFLSKTLKNNTDPNNIKSIIKAEVDKGKNAIGKVKSSARMRGAKLDDNTSKFLIDRYGEDTAEYVARTLTKDEIAQLGRGTKRELAVQREAAKPTALGKSKAVDEHYDYFKNISDDAGMTIQEAAEKGIALRLTKGGRVVPNVRKTGPFVPDDFARYDNFKDANAGIFGGSKDPTRFIQEIDGPLSIEKRVKLPGQAGPTEQNVLWRTRDMMKQRNAWFKEQQANLDKVFEGVSNKKALKANEALENMAAGMTDRAPEELLKWKKFSKITDDPEVIRVAQQTRKWLDNVLDEQNSLRKLRGQDPIPRRKFYSPEELKKQNIWSEVIGMRKTYDQAMSGPLPDYIKPDAPFNPRAMAREAGLPPLEREMNLKKLMSDYANTAGRDIFNTSIVQNNKAFAEQLRTMGYGNAASGIERWTAEAFAGVPAAIDNAANLGRNTKKGLDAWRKGLVKGVFPLNFAWNLFTQGSSAAFTVGKYGVRNTTQALINWTTSPSTRKWIESNAYAPMMKKLRSGKVTRQDINTGLSKGVELNKSKLDNASDAANFFTNWLERHVSGLSAEAARLYGKRKGVKGRALAELSSDGAAKTQSMYNSEDLPGILRNRTVKTGIPFQTFTFDAFNNLREFAGKTGVPPGSFSERMKSLLRFTAAVTVANQVSSAATGKKPWGFDSFIPFYDVLVGPAVDALKGEDVGFASRRGLPSFTGAAINFAQGMRDVIQYDDWGKLRNTSISYLPGMMNIPGGVQASRVVDGMISISKGGVEDSAGRMVYPITNTKEELYTMFIGPTGVRSKNWKKQNEKIEAENLSTLLKQQSREGSEMRFEAERLFQQWKDLPEGERKTLFGELRNSRPLVAKELSQVVEEDNLGLTRFDRTLKALNVRNGFRAKKLTEILERQGTVDKKKKLWDEWSRKGILTPEVAGQITTLLRTKTATENK